MSDLDKLLIQLRKEASSDLSDKDRIELTEDLSIKKVAFDMYKVFNDHYDGLWKIEESDGSKFLVRASDPKYELSDSGNWAVASNYDNDNIVLKYKNVPICSFSSNEYGFNKESVFNFRSAVLEAIESDQEFLKNVIATQPKTKVEALQSIFPELIKK